jgi:hypothetical protein
LSCLHFFRPSPFSGVLSHAQALADYRRDGQAAAELARAATCEEQAACLLEAGSQEREAAIHRVSAASCWEKLGQYPRAVTLLRAALGAELPDDYRDRLEEQRRHCLIAVQKELSQVFKNRPRKQSAALPMN